MKKEINLITQRPESEENKKKEKLLQKLTIGFLLAFLFLNILLFGSKFYFYKTTSDFINDAKRLTENINIMLPVEQSYRKFFSKVKYLTEILGKSSPIEKSFSFVGSLLGPEANLLKLSFTKDSKVTVEASAQDSTSLDVFVNKFKDAQTKGQISDLKIVSTNKIYDKEKNTSYYDFKISFKFIR